MLLKSKVAIVTGASRGIGREIAFRFAREGAKVAICARNVDQLNSLRDEIKAAGLEEPYVVPTDVSKEDSIQSLVDSVIDKWGEVDILVNNAGITRDGLLVRMSEEEWDEVMDANLKGAFLGTKAVAKPMMRQRHGRIINIASVIGLVGNAGQANYAASKAGIIALTQSAAKELASRNILVNAIAPGFIQTEMTEKLPEAVRNGILQAIPLKKYGSAADVAAAAVFLASDMSNYMTGQVLTVDGGMVM
ncbi:MAG: 3-oxoacyl-[acyl-carrier-protein] reductase [Candidatus Omnitrophica bacterium]|jgi:3-oxoacyl-[acyl-carrier protein] reductase|nr:3-oxoacyl-[acyl-carrier-protein] reductase [Candidatus Omnitrophota bacterium]